MKIPPSFYLAIGRFLLFIAIEAICIVMIANNGIIQQYKVAEKIRGIQSFFWEKSSNIKAYSQLKSINKELQKQNMALMEENEKIRSYKENLRGSDLTNSVARDIGEVSSAFEYDWAKVIKNTLNSTHNYIIINKGEEEGIQEDMGVITPNGAVGIVRAVGKHHAFVLSFLNSKQQVSVKLGHTNIFGPMSWDGTSTNRAILNEIPQHIPVNPGDTIYTSGYSSFFPPDIPVGIAESSEIVNGMHRSVKVKLLQDFRLLEYVIIVRNTHFGEIDSLSKFAGIK